MRCWCRYGVEPGADGVLQLGIDLGCHAGLCGGDLRRHGLLISHVNDCTRPQERVAVSTALLVVISLGCMAGPVIISLLMGLLGLSGLFVFNALACGLLLDYVSLVLQYGNPVQKGN